MSVAGVEVQHKITKRIVDTIILHKTNKSEPHPFILKSLYHIHIILVNGYKGGCWNDSDGENQGWIFCGNIGK